MKLKLRIIVGSTRPGRRGPTVAQFVQRTAEQHGGFDVGVLDLADFDLPLYDEPSHPAAQNYQHAHTKRWSAAVAEADAYIFVTPEYDAFVPAALLNAVQGLLHEWRYKPAGIVCYGGISGGLRASETLRGLLGNVDVHALAQSVPMPNFGSFIGEDGVLAPNKPMQDGMAKMLGELQRWGRALVSARQPTSGTP